MVLAASAGSKPSANTPGSLHYVLVEQLPQLSNSKRPNRLKREFQLGGKGLKYIPNRYIVRFRAATQAIGR